MLSSSDKAFIASAKRIIGKAINRYELISSGDRVAVAVSGGKDSLVLLEALSSRRKNIPIDYSIDALHVNIKSIGYEIDSDFLYRFCKSLGINFHYREAAVDISKDNRSICYICSSRRRSVMFNFMKETGCNRLALGHHMDDAVETLLMSMAYNGQISSMPARLSMFSGEFDIIRPLILLRNPDLIKYAAIKNFPKQKTPCPHGCNSSRKKLRKILDEMGALNSNAIKNMYNSMSDIRKEYLP